MRHGVLEQDAPFRLQRILAQKIGVLQVVQRTAQLVIGQIRHRSHKAAAGFGADGGADLQQFLFPRRHAVNPGRQDIS